MAFTIRIDEQKETPFRQEEGIYQDGTVPLYRDVDGKLWVIAGFSHKGHIGMFCGSTLDDMKQLYTINTNFCVGHADYAYSNVRYPEGVKARGSIWPFGLYICPNTHRFFCFFHNESAWNGKGTGYDAFGPSKHPQFDSDFRHIGLMHSDDEGRNWTFDRWVVTGENVCFTEYYNPNHDCVIPQKKGEIAAGAGDFSIFVEPDGDYIYLFYDIIHMDTERRVWLRCDCHVARTRKRTDGVMGDFVKYYDGAFCEAGNLGKESVLVPNVWHPRVAWSETMQGYIMVGSPLSENVQEILQSTFLSGRVANVLEWRTSKDLIHWSEPHRIPYKGKDFGAHYMALIDDSKDTQPHVIKGNDFTFLICNTNKDVERYTAHFE